MNSLNFQESKIQVLDLPTLARTYKENDIFGNPLKGIYHFELLTHIMQVAQDSNQTAEVWDLFAAQNQAKNAPGVSLLPQVEAQHGVNATEAHILRRVFANIRLTDEDTEELTTNVAIAFHQEGIECAIGESVIVCHNQTILCADHRAKTFGPDKLTPQQLLDKLSEWIMNSANIRAENREKIEKLKAVQVSASLAYQIIGMLTATRVAHDTKHTAIKNSETYPLNQSQISLFTENMLLRFEEKKQLNLFDVYDCANLLYKGDAMDIPSIIPQNVAMYDFLSKFM